MNWKDFMKILTLMPMALIALASCSDNDENVEDLVETAAVPMLADNVMMIAFGFYQEDNIGILSKDYVASVPDYKRGVSHYDISIDLPWFTDKSALVARFTVNPRNIATVNSVPQVSGLLKNNFTAPVDYIVTNTDKTQSVAYTVTITNNHNIDWKEISVVNFPMIFDIYSGACMRICPWNNTLFIAFKNIKNNCNKMMVMSKPQDWGWGFLGSNSYPDGFSSRIDSSHYAFDVALDGTPYVAYADLDAASQRGALSVMKLDGHKFKNGLYSGDCYWNYVGEQGFFKVQSQCVGMAALENELVVCLLNKGDNADIPYGALGVATWDGMAWTSGESSLLPAGQEICGVKMGSNGKIATMISINSGNVDGVNYGYNVFKYENGQWEALATNFLEPGATQTDTAAGSFGTFVARDGTIYIWTTDNAPNGDKEFKVRLKKYDTATKTWCTVSGGILPLNYNNSIDNRMEVQVAISPNGTPFVAYVDSADLYASKLYVMYLDPETGQWSVPQLIGTGASDVNIAFASTTALKTTLTYTDNEHHIHVLTLEE